MLLAAGAVAGAAASVYLNRRYGSIAALTTHMRAGVRGLRDYWLADRDSLEAEHDRPIASRRDGRVEEDTLVVAASLSDAAPPPSSLLSPEPPAVRRSERALEARVLAAFEEDEILGRRAVEISALGEGVVELTGWVHSTEEAVRAASVARAVPGVEMVLNRVTVRGGGHLDTASTSIEADDDGEAPPGGTNGGPETT